jgi:hypothetical protein
MIATRVEVLVLALTLLGSISAAAAHGRHTIKAHFGCTSEDEYEGLLLMASSSESSTQEAFKNELVRAALADECTTFAAGEEVHIVATHLRPADPLLGGRRLSLTKISFKGRGTRAWWTSPTVIR